MVQVRAQAGVTLIELMVAMVLGLVMIGGAIGLFSQVKRSYTENERVLQMQDDARFALVELSRDLASVGFWGELGDVGSVVTDASLTVATDCGPPGTPWVYDTADQISTVDNATGATASAQYSCLDPAVVQPGADVVAIKRVAGNTTPLPLDVGTVYLKSNGVVGLLFKHPETAPPAINVPAPASDWLYVPSIWYVRTHARDNNRADGIPTLCRKKLDDSGVPSMIDECIAQGVEDLQIDFGIDTDGDGNAERYLSAPAVADMPSVIAIRVSMLVRSATPQAGYHNNKSYRLGNRPLYQPDDNFYRRVYISTITTRNLRNQSRLGLGV